MALRDILTAPDPRLKKKSKPVAAVTGSVRALMDDMLETMYAAPGIGLAAPQVGEHLRVIVADIAGATPDDAGGGDEAVPRRPIRLANPEIVWVSDDDKTWEEGCLSVPDHYAEVVRPAEVRVRYLDENGKTREVHATGLLATVLQHEIDHLDGILFIDHLSAIKRNIILRKLLKARKLSDAEA